MDRQLILDDVKIYRKEDAAEAISLIGQDVYMSNDEKFEHYCKIKLAGVQVLGYGIPPFLGDIGIELEAYKYFILAKDAKFKEEEKTENGIFRPYKNIEEVWKWDRIRGNWIRPHNYEK